MKRDELAMALKNVALDANKPMAGAQIGEWREYLAATLKKTGGLVHHYAFKGKIWYVDNPVRQAA